MVNMSGVFGKSQDSTWLCMIAALPLVYYGSSRGNFLSNPYASYQTTDFIREHGYPVETHTVPTDDGYLLDIHRIPNRRNQTGRSYSSGPPIIFQHGFAGTSSMWVLQGAEKDLAFLLSDEGYDVWLLNSRGNHYTRVHPSATSPIDNFSFHEMGTLDLMASIDFILNMTGYRQLTFVGYSMGNSLLLAGLSTRPEYNPKINHVFSLAPMVARSPPSTLGLKILEYLYIADGLFGNRLTDLFWIAKRINNIFLVNFAPFVVNEVFKNIAGPATACNMTVPSKVLYTQMVDKIQPSVLDHYYENLYSNGVFLMRDHGRKENLRRYNATKPPSYNLRNVAVPITAYVGSADIIAPIQDFVRAVPWYSDKNVKIKAVAGFNHFDLIWAEEALQTVFESIILDLRVIMANLEDVV